MDLATKGISWAESIFHKCEDIYRDGIMAKEPGKIVDVVGEQLRKIYEEVTDDLLNPFSFVDDSIPKDDHQKLMSSSDGKLMDDDPPTTSSSSSSSLSLSSLPSSSSSSPSSATCSGGQSIVESSGLCRDVFDKNDELTQVGIISSEVNVHTEEITSASTLKVLKSFDPNNLESKEFRQTHTAILTEEEDEKENGRDEEFDDVGLEDFHERKKHLDELEEADSCELALISQRAMKNHSYKKKLRDMLASNFYSARKKWGSRLGGASDTMIEERSMRGASATAIQGISTARGLSVQRPSSSESDWELV